MNRLGFADILQAERYNGSEPLFDPRVRTSPITPALWFAHARRGFFEPADIQKKAREGEKGKPVSPLALEAVLRLDALFEIERAVLRRGWPRMASARRGRSRSIRWRALSPAWRWGSMRW